MMQATLKPTKGPDHVINTILLIVLVLLVIGALPAWPYSSGWGYFPVVEWASFC